MELNEDGAKLLRYAESIIELVDKVESDLSPNSGAVKGSVYIGAGKTTNMRYMGEAMKLTLERFPEIDFQIFSGTSIDLMGGMARSAYDFLVECELNGHADMNVLELPIQDRWGVIASKDSRLSALRRVRPDDLAGQPLLMSRQAMKAGMLDKWAGKVANDLNVRVVYSLPLNAGRASLAVSPSHKNNQSRPYWIIAASQLRKFITSEIIISFSSGFDSAIMMVAATSALSLITFLPDLCKVPFLSRKYRKTVAAMRLFPSWKEWFFTMK